MKSLHRAMGSVLVLASVGFLAADDEHHHHEGGPPASEQLGRVSFANSCAPAAQESFERALALLHSFWYEESEKGFAAVARQDPGCAIAYWGVAMSLYHTLWETPDAVTLKRGREALQKAGAIGAKTERERDYIGALAVFYRDSEKLDHETGAAAYARAMKQVYLRYPGDREAAIFYALSLLGSAPPHDTEFANRKKAAAILEKVFAADSDHPGVAHYLIHAYDTPRLAALGLNAARRYAQIAPSSPHALHMPSHIFTRLGLWQESIDSNLASIAATHHATEMHMGGASHQLHAMDFLEYAYLQSGREAEARDLIEKVKTMPAMEGHDLAYPRAELPARYAIELHHWREAAALEPPAGASPAIQTITYWARAIGAARSGDVAGARQDVDRLNSLHAASVAENKTYAYTDVEVEQQEGEAWLAYAEGKKAEAVQTLRAAAEREDASGPDTVAIPAREMLADMLLDSGRAAEALGEYETSLREAPNRFDGLYGAARAAELAGDPGKAKTFYAKLAAVCDHAGSQRPELQEARLFLAKR